MEPGDETLIWRILA